MDSVVYPGEHAMQVSLDAAPSVALAVPVIPFENVPVPAGQAKHAAIVCPRTGLYVPDGHCVQVEKLVPPGKLL